MALLLNMARRLSFAVAQSITIIGWFISSILLIALVVAATYGMKLPGQDRALTQAFYYAIIASGLYFVIATLMCVTVYGAYKGHYPQEFKLTMSQRTLMLQTISFMVYMMAGAAVFYKVEGWQFLDSVYFTNYTLLTVGIGDYAPQTHTGRALLFPYAVGGIVILGLVVGSIRSLVLERGKQKLSRRMVEKKREQKLRKMKRKGEQLKLNPVSSERHAKEIGMSERQRREMEFDLMREIQEHASQRQKWNALFISGSAWLILWLVGAAVFYKAEHAQGWSYFGSLYFAYTSLLTIGYGDYKNFSNSGKPAFVFWSLLAVPTLTIVISNMGDTVVKGIRDITDFLGEFTVLPGEASTKARAKQLIIRVKAHLTNLSPREKLMDKSSGSLRKSDTDSSDEKPERGAPAATSDREAGQIGQGEENAAGQAENQDDRVSNVEHEYHFQLAREFRKVMKHTNESPPRKYTYDEWAWFLKLIGEDEDGTSSHRTAPIKVQKQGDQEADMQKGAEDQADRQVRQWSWLGNRSPLMGETAEAVWVLERLSITLENELKRRSERMKRKERDSTVNVANSRGSSRKTLEHERVGPAGKYSVTK